MSRAYDLYVRYTIEELQAKMDALRADPKNQNPEGSFWKYTAACRRKTDDIAWAITYHLKDLRKVKDNERKPENS